mmetsp:Transcript_26547/g.58566  ORF Transcript_26547/g.58566 Transcript_26547/m.58566 type:complete len:138 (-) Transcript_26547:118-531(-)|eukprot:CAMPEP_0204316982 /NCGR_PEP_ID=MMETSP0469-20131031/5709_1 /ASSEMBLY_ACC=CAM_ASM_000384 /TAXON_ID=2969 /ORGANISM="Oxyrrhis marina" /LENGTH=137 /DNA_ID=CAMNT_0051297837 /DNA_START=61 /DNA_END=474 /DNA_ORIENTATION=+
MTSNSIRGGKHGFQCKTLIGNWFEQRYEPGYQVNEKMGKDRLPGPREKMFTRTSEKTGEWFQQEMRSKYAATETESWLNYQPVDNSMYVTTTAEEFVKPEEQRAKFMAPEIPEDRLDAYRNVWTSGEPHQFEKYDKK